MSHLDPEQIALLALGEPAASLTDCAHLRSCATCAAEIEELGKTVRLARTTVGEVDLESPPERVWDAIAAEVGIAAHAPHDAALEAVRDDDAVPAPQTAAPLRTSGRRRWVFALAAAVVLVAGIGLGTWVVTAAIAPTTIAQAVLDPFPSHPDAGGSAGVEQSRSGARELVVTVTGGDAEDSYREVWLIRNDAGALISLGVLDGDTGTFPIPAGIDLSEYGLVDVSVEPIDGDPAHSGDSIVRGALGTI